MKRHFFTEEQQEFLRQNKWTYSVNETTLVFSVEFKKEFWKRYQAGQLPTEIFTELGYDASVLGRCRIQNSTLRIRKEAESGNFTQGGRRNKHSVLTENLSELGAEKSLEKLQAEVLYLRQEIDFLKKISGTRTGKQSKESL